MARLSDASPPPPPLEGIGRPEVSGGKGTTRTAPRFREEASPKTVRTGGIVGRVWRALVARRDPN